MLHPDLVIYGAATNDGFHSIISNDVRMSAIYFLN